MDALKLLKNPLFLFVVVLFGWGAVEILKTLGGPNPPPLYAVAFVIFGFVLLAIGVILLYYRNEQRKSEFTEECRQRDVDNERRKIEFAEACRQQKEDFENLRAENEQLQSKVNNPPINMIGKGQYGALLKQWNDSGEGEVLLYNIELQSFTDRESIRRTWGGLKDLKNIKQVCILLPKWKIERWEQAVLTHSSDFFADPANQRFHVCEFEASLTVGEGPSPTGIAFAMYRYTDAQGSLHPTVVWFVLSRPFAILQDHYYNLDAKWWDYKHILAVRDREDLRAKAIAIWEPIYNPGRSRDVIRVLEDSKPLEIIEPEAFFQRIWLPEDKKKERLAQLDNNRQKASESPSPIPLDKEEGIFEIRYNNGDLIAGHYEGIDVAQRVARPGVVWVGGFTEKHYSELWRIFEHCLKHEEVVRFYYEVSPPIEDVTITRYCQDMREVLLYVNRQNVVIKNQLVVIARSINGLAAALAASDPEIRKMLSGVILVAPVFDVVEMMDNYRQHRGQGHVRIEKAWRAAPGYVNGVEWEQPRMQRNDGSVQGGWLEYFGYEVGLQIVADICRHPVETFRLDGFKNAIAKISEHCPVYILSHPKDPITGSERALEALHRGAEGSILIKNKNFKYIPIESKHLKPEEIEKGSYPFRRSEPREVQTALRNILLRLGLPTTKDDGHAADGFSGAQL
ncbi:MAG: hypothetical protein AABZ47_13135 [Planctomycetota bacterium]